MERGGPSEGCLRGPPLFQSNWVDRDTQRHTHTHTDTRTHRRHTDVTQTQTPRHRHAHTQTHSHTQTHVHTDVTQTHDTHTHTHAQKRTDTDTDTGHTDTETNPHVCTHAHTGPRLGTLAVLRQFISHLSVMCKQLGKLQQLTGCTNLIMFPLVWPELDMIFVAFLFVLGMLAGGDASRVFLGSDKSQVDYYHCG